MKYEKSYPCTVRPDGILFVAEFIDFPEANGFGDTAEEALSVAAECLGGAIGYRMSEGRDVPSPSVVHYVRPDQDCLNDMRAVAQEESIPPRVKNPNRTRCGLARAAALSPERRKEIAALAGNERWRKWRLLKGDG